MAKKVHVEHVTLRAKQKFMNTMTRKVLVAFRNLTDDELFSFVWFSQIFRDEIPLRLLFCYASAYRLFVVDILNQGKIET